MCNTNIFQKVFILGRISKILNKLNERIKSMVKKIDDLHIAQENSRKHFMTIDKMIISAEGISQITPFLRIWYILLVRDRITNQILDVVNSFFEFGYIYISTHFCNEISYWKNFQNLNPLFSGLN